MMETIINGKITKGTGVSGQRYLSQVELSIPETVKDFKINDCHL